MSRHATLAAVAALTSVLIAGCGAEQAPTSTSPISTASAPAGLTASEQAFVDQVAAIAPPLAENPERLARRGSSSCTSITDGRPSGDAVDQAVERFSGGGYTVTNEQAAAIVDVARKTVCSTS